MVGVPGRSRACNVCKQRKVSCDKRLPECGECIKTRRKCDYTKKHVFVLNDEGSHRTVYRKPTGAGSRNTTLVQSNSHVTRPAFRGNEVLSLPRRSIPQISNAAVMEQQLVSGIMSMMANGDSMSHDFPTHTWMSVSKSLADSPEAPLSSPLACCFAWLSRRKSDPAMRNIGRNFYLKGIVEARKALLDPSLALADRTLASCLALVVYETLECPEETMKSYRWHREGCLRLVELRGPRRHMTGLGHQLLIEARFHGILEALEKRRPSFLISEEWMTVPWTIQPKTDHDRLVDILAQGPRILYKSELLTNIPLHQALDMVMSMCKDCWKVDEELRLFQQDLQNNSPGPLYWELPSKKVGGSGDANDSSSEEESFSTAIHFRDLEVAGMMTFCWAIQCMVWNGLAYLYGTLDQMDDPPLDHRRAGLRPMQWLEPIQKICKSVESCTKSSSPGLGAMRIAGPLNIIIDVMKLRMGCTKEFIFASAAKKELGRTWMRILECPAET